MCFFFVHLCPSDREGPVTDYANQCVFQQSDQRRSAEAETGPQGPGLALPRHWVLSGHWHGENTHTQNLSPQTSRLHQPADSYKCTPTVSCTYITFTSSLHFALVFLLLTFLSSTLFLNSLSSHTYFLFSPLQVVSCLLLFLEEEDALWMMCALIEDLLPPSYFSSTLLGVQTDQRVLRQLIVQYLPALDRLLQEHDIGKDEYWERW